MLVRALKETRVIGRQPIHGRVQAHRYLLEVVSLYQLWASLGIASSFSLSAVIICAQEPTWRRCDISAFLLDLVSLGRAFLTYLRAPSSRKQTLPQDQFLILCSHHSLLFTPFAAILFSGQS
jgi:hypothetical protein